MRKKQIQSPAPSLQCDRPGHAQELAAACNLAPSSSAGYDVRDRAARGLTPQRDQEWLLPDAVGPPPGLLPTGPLQQPQPPRRRCTGPMSAHKRRRA